MSQDFAKKKPRSKTGRASVRKSSGTSQKQRRTNDKRSDNDDNNGSVRPFFGGLITGVFLCFLLYLGTVENQNAGNSPGAEMAQSQPQTSQQDQPSTPKLRFEFYKRLQEQTMEVEVEPASDVSKPRDRATVTDTYVLQAGSFRQLEDADRRRAQLILLGLEPTIEETSGDNGRWFRVYVGPFETHSSMQNARSLTANQDIDTLLLKRDRP